MSRTSLLRLLAGAAALCVGLATAADLPAPASQALLASGARIYLEGITSSGAPLVGVLSQGQRVEGSAAACVSCHRRSGQGAAEGRILVPPITAEALSQPGVFAPAPGQPPSERTAIAPRYQSRHAYDDAHLARALSAAEDPDGRPLVDPMPRYALSAPDLAALQAYLAGLGRGLPGAQTGDTFWLVLTAAADPGRRAVVRAVVEAFARDLPPGTRPWQLRVIDLGATPGELQRALDDPAIPPPLALLSGAGADDWGAIESVCEQRGIPCLFPSLAAAPAPGAERRYYSQYFSEGLTLEARALAHEVQADPGPACRHPRILALADGHPDLVEAAVYRAGLLVLQHGLPEAQTLLLGNGGITVDASTAALCVVAWLPEPMLSRAWAAVPADTSRWWLPLGLLPMRGLAPPPVWRTHLRLVSALDPEAPLRVRTTLAPWLARHQLDGLDPRIAADALGACTLTLAALGNASAERIRGMRVGELSRDELVESLEHVARTERMPGVDHYAPIALGGVSRIAARMATVLAWPGPDAPEPRVLRRFVPD